MPAYGRGQMLGSGINPESFKQDYSGFANAAAMQAQGLSNLGASISGSIQDFSKDKDQRKKIDAETKASRAGIESAIKLGDSLGFNVKEMLSPVLSQMDNPNTSPIEAAALGREASMQIANVLNLGFKAQGQEAQRASLIQDAVYKNAQLEIAQQNANSRAQAAMAAGGNAPQLVDVPLGDGSAQKMQWDRKSQSYTPIRVSVFNPPLPTAEETAMPGDGTYPDYGGISEAMVLPDKVDPDAITAAAELTGGKSDVSNVLPIPIETSTTTQTQVVDGIPTTQNQGGIGFIPAKTSAKSFRRATPEEASGYGATAGQIDEQTGRFYPINLPSGMTVESDGQGGIKVVQGSGVGGKAKEAEAERKKQQSSFVDEFTKTAAETIKLLPSLPDNPVGAKFGAALGEILPGTEQGRVVSRLNTIKANLALDKINQMRAASPTGGSAGSMTVQEWPLFMQEFGSLDAAENKQDLEARLKNASVKLFNRVNGTPEERQSALEKGIITKEQNGIVQKQYDEMLSTLGIPIPKVPTSSLGSQSQDIYNEFLNE